MACVFSHTADPAIFAVMVFRNLPQNGRILRKVAKNAEMSDASAANFQRTRRTALRHVDRFRMN